MKLEISIIVAAFIVAIAITISPILLQHFKLQQCVNVMSDNSVRLNIVETTCLNIMK